MVAAILGILGSIVGSLISAVGIGCFCWLIFARRSSVPNPAWPILFMMSLLFLMDLATYATIKGFELTIITRNEFLIEVLESDDLSELLGFAVEDVFIYAIEAVVGVMVGRWICNRFRDSQQAPSEN